MCVVGVALTTRTGPEREHVHRRPQEHRLSEPSGHLVGVDGNLLVEVDDRLDGDVIAAEPGLYPLQRDRPDAFDPGDTHSGLEGGVGEMYVQRDRRSGVNARGPWSR